MWTCPDCGREFKRTNQHHFCAGAPKTMDEYVSKRPPEQQKQLNAVREAVRAALPEAEEGIAWSMPNWKYAGKNLMQMSANSGYISLYPGQKVIAALGEALDGFETKKDAVYIKDGRSVPDGLLELVVKACAGEME